MTPTVAVNVVPLIEFAEVAPIAGGLAKRLLNPVPLTVPATLRPPASIKALLAAVAFVVTLMIGVPAWLFTCRTPEASLAGVIPTP